jgi:transglutaminase-like putative cysteine protease
MPAQGYSTLSTDRARRLEADIIPLGILVGLVLLATAALEAADWVPGLWLVTRAALAGVLLGWAAARLTRVPEWVSQPVAALISMGWIYYQLATLIILRRPEANRYLELFLRVRRWFEALLTNSTVEDPLLFVAMLSLSLWLIGYVGSWTLTRSRWVWPSVIPGVMVILINMIYSAKDMRLFLVLYLLLSLVLLAVCHAQSLDSSWHRMGVRFAGTVTRRIILSSMVLSVVLLALAWNVPSGTVDFDPGSLWKTLTAPWDQVQERLGRILTSAVRGGRAEYSSFGPNFDIGGPVRLSDRPVMLVHSEKPDYWAVAVYDEYTGQGWRSSALPNEAEGTQGEEPLLLAGRVDIPLELQDRSALTQTITILEPRSGYLPGATMPMGFDRNVLLQVAWITTTYNLEVGALGSTVSQPELRVLRDLLNQWYWRAKGETWVRERAQVQNGSIRDPDTLLASLPWSRLTLRSIAGSVRAAWASMAQRGVSVEIVMEDGIPQRLIASGRFPVLEDIRAVSPQSGTVGPGYRYTVVSSVPAVSPEKLRSAGNAYPDWVREKYLQLPAQLPQRVKDLALQITGGADNNYDKAKAVEKFLREYTYNENVPFVPRNRDAVDYFLFDIKQGYCTSYASAMVVLLRAAGIPARMVTGFTTGGFDDSQNAYVVADSNAHAWPEVYFPGYGWIPFEPTSSRPQIVLDEPSGTGLGGLDAGPTSGTVAASGRRLTPDEGVSDTEAPSGPNSPISLPAGPLSGMWTVPALLALVLLLGLWFLWNRRFRGLSAAAAVYQKTLALARLAGAAWSGGSTPLERATAIAEVVPRASHQVRLLAEVYSTEIYGASRPRISVQLLHACWRGVRRILLVKILVRPLRALLDRSYHLLEHVRSKP